MRATTERHAITPTAISPAEYRNALEFIGYRPSGRPASAWRLWACGVLHNTGSALAAQRGGGALAPIPRLPLVADPNYNRATIGVHAWGKADRERELSC